MRLFSGILLLSLVLSGSLIAQTFVPGEILVKTSQPWQSKNASLKSTLTQGNAPFEIRDVESVVTRKNKGLARLSATRNRDDFYIYKLSITPDTDIKALVSTLSGQEIAGNEILFAQPNYIYKLTTYPIQNAPGYNTYQSANLSLIGMEEAWEYSVGSENVVIAVIDSGIDTNHQEFGGQFWENPGEIVGNGIDDDNNGFIDDIIGYDIVNNTPTPEDDNGHGTHVSGIASAKGSYLTGVCPGCRIMSVKAADAAGNLTDSDVIKSLNYAIDNGANIINMSFGGPAGFTQRTLMQDIIDEGHEAGIVFVAALGNDNRNTNNAPFYPAAYEHVLAISSVDSNGYKSSFSNFGSVNFIAAPGTSIYASYPSTNVYAILSGTSMATPHVAGAIGLMKSVMPWLTPNEIATALQLSAQDRGSSGHDSYYGYGILNLPMAIRYADTIPATLFELTTPNTILSGEPISISVKATDNMSVREVRLYYKYYEQNSPLGDWASIAMTDMGNTLYSGAIPAGPAVSTTVHAYLAGYDLNPSNPVFLPTGGASDPIVIRYPDDIAGPHIAFISQSGDFIASQTEAWVTDNHNVATASITVTINTGVDEGQFTMADNVLTYTDTGLLTISLSNSGLVIPDSGSIKITISAADTTGNISSLSRSFTQSKTLMVIDAEQRKDRFLTYPNPFNPSQEACIFSYQLSNDAEITLSIYSLSMKEVQKWTLPTSYGFAGYHEYSWDGRDKGGNILPNGVYLAVMAVSSNGEQKVLRRHIAIKR